MKKCISTCEVIPLTDKNVIITPRETAPLLLDISILFLLLLFEDQIAWQFAAKLPIYVLVVGTGYPLGPTCCAFAWCVATSASNGKAHSNTICRNKFPAMIHNTTPPSSCTPTNESESFEKSFELLSASPDIPAKYQDEPPVNLQLTSARQVKLDVGGFKFSTTLTTLTADPNSMLAAMFSGRFPVEKNEEGCIFIDRDGQHFNHILNWLRNGYIPHIESPTEKESVLIEAKYYQITSLIDFLSTSPQEKYTLKQLLNLINSVSSKKKVQLASADLSKLNLNGLNLPAGKLCGWQ